MTAVSNLDKVVAGLTGSGQTDFEIECGNLKNRIRTKLNQKLAELPKDVQETLVANCILSGGAIASLYHNEEPKDYDLWSFFSTIIPLIQMKLQGVEDFSTIDTGKNYSEMGVASFTSPNAVTLKNSIQFITLGDYQSQREKFDFVHCKPYYNLYAQKLFISEEQWSCIKNKKLVISPGQSPSDIRISKFVGRGWRH